MTNQFSDFIAVLAAFGKYNVDYVLVGGVAIILHGFARLTEDVDVFVKMTPANVENLRKALHSVFEDASIDEITFDELDKYPVVRYGTPTEFNIDIIARLGEVATYEDVAYEIVEYEGTKIKLATAEALYTLKKDTLRDKDKIDARFLKMLIEESQD